MAAQDTGLIQMPDPGNYAPLLPLAYVSVGLFTSVASKPPCANAASTADTDRSTSMVSLAKVPPDLCSPGALGSRVHPPTRFGWWLSGGACNY